MTRPTIEITEEMKADARWVLDWFRSDRASRLAEAILAAIPTPPRPLAVGDVVDGWEDEDQRVPWTEFKVTVVGFADEKVAVLRLDYPNGDVEYMTDTDRQYRVGEGTPAPWPWEVSE